MSGAAGRGRVGDQSFRRNVLPTDFTGPVGPRIKPAKRSLNSREVRVDGGEPRQVSVERGMIVFRSGRLALGVAFKLGLAFRVSMGGIEHRPRAYVP